MCCRTFVLYCTFCTKIRSIAGEEIVYAWWNDTATLRHTNSIFGLSIHGEVLNRMKVKQSCNGGHRGRVRGLQGYKGPLRLGTTKRGLITVVFEIVIVVLVYSEVRRWTALSFNLLLPSIAVGRNGHRCPSRTKGPWLCMWL